MKTLLVLSSIFPEPKSTAAGRRMLRLLSLFQEYGYSIHYAATGKETDFSYPLKAIGISTHSIVLNTSDFDILLSSINPEIVLYDRFLIEEQFGWRVAQSCPNALTILDTEDLHFLRAIREKDYKSNSLTSKENYIENKNTKREIASILKCDLSLIISKVEQQLLTDTFKIPGDILFYLPFLVEDKEILPSPTPFEKRKNFVSIGNFRHQPNWASVLYLKKEIWPKLRKRVPEASLEIYGAYANEKVYQLHNKKEGFVVHGRAESVQQVMLNTRVLLAPLPFGAGLKGKLLYAMLTGTPSVTNTIGAEGMSLEGKWNGFILNNTKDFVAKASELYLNKNLWNNAQYQGYQLLKPFDKKLYYKTLKSTIDTISNNLKQHRNKNTYGLLLKEKEYLATKYLSKWIEEKNKDIKE